MGRPCSNPCKEVGISPNRAVGINPSKVVGSNLCKVDRTAKFNMVIINKGVGTNLSKAIKELRRIKVVGNNLCNRAAGSNLCSIVAGINLCTREVVNNQHNREEGACSHKSMNEGKYN
jgi:hypothetical protein